MCLQEKLECIGKDVRTLLISLEIGLLPATKASEDTPDGAAEGDKPPQPGGDASHARLEYPEDELIWGGQS